MAINKKLIHFKNKENFDNEVANGNILDTSIVFIQDSKEISTHGTVYKTVNWSILEPFKINTEGKANGVYAVTAEGELIAYNDAAVDATCLGVALITDNQKIMIEKMGEANAEWDSNTFFWGINLYGKNVAGITETINKAGAKADFNGKDNTIAIIAAYTEHSVAMNAQDMCSVLQTFNNSDNNGGFTDWYIPAAGLFYEIYTNMTNINAALTAIGGTAFVNEYYWSSSECNSNYGWSLYFNGGNVSSGYKSNYHLVRFVRDI